MDAGPVVPVPVPPFPSLSKGTPRPKPARPPLVRLLNSPPEEEPRPDGMVAAISAGLGLECDLPAGPGNVGGVYTPEAAARLGRGPVGFRSEGKESGVVRGEGSDVCLVMIVEEEEEEGTGVRGGTGREGRSGRGTGLGLLDSIGGREGGRETG